MTPALSALRRKIDLRLLPYLFVLYVVAYLDRVNVSFAAPALTRELGFSSGVFGLGAGMFFAGYVLCEVPSNLILRRVGARLWIARIMVTWGLIACAMAAVHADWSFHTLRFLLGVAEAGFLPGIIYYLTLWYPPARRARAVALFMAATPVAGIVGGPLSGLLLDMHGALGLSGWRWMFLLEGLPAVLLGFSVLKLLPDGPADAPWLSPGERALLASELDGGLAREQAPAGARAGEGLRGVLSALARDGRVWLLCLAYFALCVGMYGLVMWMPTLIGEVLGPGASSERIGLLSAIPYLGGAAGMVLIGRHSDRTGERPWHTAGPLFVSATGFLLAPWPAPAALFGPWWSLACFTVSTIGLWGMLGPFWTIPTGLLSGANAAGGIALINSVGNVGGFVGPTLVGYVRDATGSHSLGFLFIAGVMALGGGAILWVTRRERAALPPSPTSTPTSTPS